MIIVVIFIFSNGYWFSLENPLRTFYFFFFVHSSITNILVSGFILL